MSLGKQYIVRLISSQDHTVSKQELIQTIRETGTDRYDKDHKQIFDYFYGPHKVDFFGIAVSKDDLEDFIITEVETFGHKTMGDRNTFIRPDICIIYDSGKCEMVKNVYEDKVDSDCFRFKTKPLNALIEVREV